MTGRGDTPRNAPGNAPGNAPANTLELRGVGLRLGGRDLFRPLDLAVAAGEVATLMGPSGCGKSSLLAFLCGTLDPAIRAQGRILLDGAEIGRLPPEKRRIGILFQDDLLFPHLSVAENLAFGLPPALRGRRARRARIFRTTCCSRTSRWQRTWRSGCRPPCAAGAPGAHASRRPWKRPTWLASGRAIRRPYRAGSARASR